VYHGIDVVALARLYRDGMTVEMAAPTLYPPTEMRVRATDSEMAKAPRRLHTLVNAWQLREELSASAGLAQLRRALVLMPTSYPPRAGAGDAQVVLVAVDGVPHQPDRPLPNLIGVLSRRRHDFLPWEGSSLHQSRGDSEMSCGRIVSWRKSA